VLLSNRGPLYGLCGGKSCGPIVENAGDDVDLMPRGLSEEMSYWSRKHNDYFMYATDCYGAKAPSNSDACKQYSRLSLEYKMDRNATCPFAADVCKSRAGNLVLDTESIDSIEHLGINRGPRFLTRTRIHCAPLKTKGFTEIETNPTTSQTFIKYKYGFRSMNASYIYKARVDNNLPEKSWEDDVVSIGDYRVR